MYDRHSTLLELSRTPIGRVLRTLIAQQARKFAAKPSEEQLYAGAVAYMTLDQVVFMSRGGLPWAVVDPVIDLANGQPLAAVRRLCGAATQLVRGWFHMKAAHESPTEAL